MKKSFLPANITTACFFQRYNVDSYNMFSIKFWFTMRPGDLPMLAIQIMAGFLLLLIVLAFFSFLIKKRVRGPWQKIWQMLNSFSISNIIVGIFLIFFGYERLPFLAMRIWLLVWALTMIFWLVLVARKAFKIKSARQKIDKEKEYNKYIP